MTGFYIIVAGILVTIGLHRIGNAIDYMTQAIKDAD